MMDFIEVTHHNPMGQCLNGPCEFVGILSNVWNPNLLSNSTHVNNIFFTLDNDYIELSNSIIEGAPKVELMLGISGQAVTLSLKCRFKFSNLRIAGKIKILNVLNSTIISDYELELKNVETISTIGLRIADDSFRNERIINEFTKSNLSLMYKKGSQMISLFDKLTDEKTKLLVQKYILEICTKELYSEIESEMLRHIDMKICVSNQVGGDHALSDQYRIHELYMKAAFNIFTDKIFGLTNELIEKDSPNLHLPKIFEILNSKDEQQILKAHEAFISNLHSLKRQKNSIILQENNLFLLYIPVAFNSLHIKYTEGEENKECYKTEDSYLKISLKRLSADKVKIDLLDFRIKKFSSLSQTRGNLILDYKVSFVIEEKVKEYLGKVLQREDVHSYAIHPPEVEINYEDVVI